MAERVYSGRFAGVRDKRKKRTVPNPATLETIGGPFGTPLFNPRLIGANKDNREYSKPHRVMGKGTGA